MLLKEKKKVKMNRMNLFCMVSILPRFIKLHLMQIFEKIYFLFQFRSILVKSRELAVNAFAFPNFSAHVLLFTDTASSNLSYELGIS